MGCWFVACKYLVIMALEGPVESSDESAFSARKDIAETARRMALTAMLLDFKVLIQSAFRGSTPQNLNPVSVTDRRTSDKLDPFFIPTLSL